MNKRLLNYFHSIRDWVLVDFSRSSRSKNSEETQNSMTERWMLLEENRRMRNELDRNQIRINSLTEEYKLKDQKISDLRKQLELLKSSQMPNKESPVKNFKNAIMELEV